MSDLPIHQPIHEFTTRRRIEFADTDMAGIVHFARFFVFMETAEHELLRHVGMEVHSTVDGMRIGWPRKATRCEYLRPVRFADEVVIHVSVLRKGRTSLTFEHVFEHDGEVIARGRMTSVCCQLDAPGGLRAVPIPALIAERLVARSQEENPPSNPPFD